jgi:hypothetical protein
MDWPAFLSGIAGTAVGAGVFGVLLNTLLLHRLTKARDAESRAFELREKRQEESRAVVEILSEWVRPRYTGEIESGEVSNDTLWKMQTTYWRNIMGLDPHLIKLLFPRLANEKDAVSVHELIVQARGILLGLAEPDLEADDLNRWPPSRGPNARS